MYSNIPLLKKTGRGQNVQYRDIFLYSTIDPEGSVLKRIERIDIKADTLLFIPSPVLGYGVNKLLKNIPPGTQIFCVEADERLMKLFIEYGSREISADNRLSIIRTSDPVTVVNYFKGLKLNTIRRIQTIYLSRGYQLYREAYDSIEKALEETIEHYWQNRITLINMNSLWIKNIIDNLQYIYKCRDVSSLSIKKPILIVGAGPSLEDNFNLIKQFRERYTLISVDTALPILGSLNITPDYIFVLDAQLDNISDFIPYKHPDAALITDFTVHPTVFRKFNFKGTYIYHSSFAEFSFFKRMREYDILPLTIPPLGSVGGAAVYIALSLSTGPVFIAGLDFSYPKGKTHAKGSTFSLNMQLENRRLAPLSQLNFRSIINRPLKNIHTTSHKNIKTDIVLNIYAQQLNRILQKHNRVFNLSTEQSPLISIPVRTEKHFKKIIDSAEITIAHKVKNFPYENVKKFIRNEISILDISADRIRDYLNASSFNKSEMREQVLICLEAADYIYGGFPDSDMEKQNNRSFLKRLYVALVYYLNRIKRVDKLF
ncbi:MAG: DUF115 domain-containing protein [Spirochaetales bacterium]|nr:DUF115 domain-containing protein [Spirochaetales bacterium]